MAKINILFNETNYNFNEESLSNYASLIKSHITNNMSGSGATIDFDGVSYNIDSAKLSTFKNDFISYLGTISGNGSKVSVNGVQYNIDSTKLANAISELDVVFGNLNSEVEGNVTILPPTTLPFQEDENTGLYTFEASENFEFIKGKQYTIIFDGVAYKCTVHSFEFDLEGEITEILYTGNGDLLEGFFKRLELESSSAPFVIAKAGHFGILTALTDPYHTIEILG